MADVQSNIKVSIDTTEALASIKNLQRQISAFHTSMAKGGAAANAVTSQMQQNLINSLNATGKFSAQMRTIKTTTESFTSSLEKNKFSMGEYFRYAGGASKTFGRLFKTEFETINKVARENVKDLQTQYIKMGRDANGAMKAIAVRPLTLDMNDLATKTMVAAQKQAILNQLLKQGSTNLLNFGKNTQWAGRQLMVGFTIPLMALGAAASKTFMDMETQAIRFKKVYGDLFTSTKESTAALEEIKALGKEFTKYGIAVKDTVGLAAEAAAAGFKGVDLQRQTAAATRLSVLGQVESQKALETTIALQNAFSMSSQDLATNIDFLNAVENQTVLSLDDMATAIPKAAPVIQQLGGDVKDLAFFMTAMKEGGINASEGANALKSGLASMINPTGKAAAMLNSLGINIKKIVVDNKGDLKKTVIDFATALNELDPLNRAQAIEQMFGKFQFARLSTLFANVTKEGTQASRVLDLAGSSIQELAALSEKELGMTSQSAMNKFKASVENLKLSLVPVGEEFLKAVTPIAEFVTKILDKFNNLGDGTKKIIVTLTAIVAGLGPVFLMTFGLLMNGLANIIKGFTFMKSLFNKTGQASTTLGTEIKYMNTEQRNAAAVAASLDQTHRKLAQTFSVEAASVDALTRAYQRSVAAQSLFMPTRVPLSMNLPTKRAKGKPAIVGGTGNKDTELALLMPGETVIPKEMSKKYGSLINGMIAGSIPGYEFGKPSPFSFGGKDFNISQRSLPGIQRIITEAQSLSGVIGNIDDVIFTSLDRLSTDLGGSAKITAGKLQAALSPITDLARSTYAKQQTYSGNAGVVMAHGLPKTTLTPEQITGLERLDTGTNFGPRLASRSGGPVTGLSNMVFPMPAGFNQDRMTGAEGAQWIGQNRSRFTSDIAAQAGLDPNDPDLLRFGTAVGKSLKSAAHKGVIVTQDDFEKIISDALEKEIFDVGKNTSTAVKTAFADAKKVSAIMYPEVSKASGRESYPRVAVPTAARGTTVAGVDLAKGSSYKNRAVDPAMNVEADKFTVESVRARVRKFFTKMHQGVEEEVKKVLDIDSPSKVTKRLGNDTATGFVHGIKELNDDAKNAGRRIGSEIVGGASQSGRTYRKATRPQGAAPIGPDTPQGAMLLPMVGMSEKEKQKARNKRGRKAQYANIKKVGAKFGGVQGSVGLMGANMALSAAPDFAGKNIIQSTMTGASMGMLFGPWGAAAGAAIGLVSSAIGELIEKQKIQKAMTEAAFKSSADFAAFFGNEIVNVDTSISNFSASLGILGGSVDNLGKQFGYTTDELARFSEMVNSLPEGNPLKDLITGLTDEKNPEKILELAKAFVTTQVALGQIKPDQAQKSLDLILAQSGKVAMVGSSFMDLKSQTQAVTKTLKDASGSSLSLGTALTQVTAAANNASSLEQLNMILDGVAESGISAAEGLTAMYYAYVQVGNLNAAEATLALKQVTGITQQQSNLIMAAVSKGFRATINPATQADNLAESALKFLTDPKVWAKTDPSAVTKKYRDLANAQIKSTKEQIKLLKAKKKLIDDEIKKEQAITDELKKQSDYTKKQQDLDQQIVEAKIRGKYIEAANLLQEKQSNTIQFNKEQTISDLQEKSDAIQAQIDAIQAMSDDVVSAINDSSDKAATNAANIITAIQGWIKVDTEKTGKSPTTAAPVDVTPETIKAYIEQYKPAVTVTTSTGGAGTSASVTTVPLKPEDLDPKTAWNDNKKWWDITRTTGQSKEAFEKMIRLQIQGKLDLLEKDTDFIFVSALGADGFTYKFKVVKNGEFIRVGQPIPPVKKAEGGYIKHFKPGGKVRGPGTKRSDSIPAYLSNGEYVIKADSVAKYGTETFDALNAQKFHTGGKVHKHPHAEEIPKSISIGNGWSLPVKPTGSTWKAAPVPNRKDYKTVEEYLSALYDGHEFYTPPTEQYPTDHIKSPMGTLKRFLEVARSQVGKNHNYKLHDKTMPEGYDSTSVNKFSIWANKTYKLGSDVQLWCGAFVAWVAENSGVPISKKMFSAYQSTKDYDAKGQLFNLNNKNNLRDILPGDLLWFKMGVEGTGPGHATIAESRPYNGGIKTVGQWGSGVSREFLPLKDLFGSARPEFLKTPITLIPFPTDKPTTEIPATPSTTDNPNPKISEMEETPSSFANGGSVFGAGTATSDSIPAYLSNGEYVIKANSVKKYGTETFDALNAGKFANGGAVQGFATGGNYQQHLFDMVKRASMSNFAPHNMGMQKFVGGDSSRLAPHDMGMGKNDRSRWDQFNYKLPKFSNKGKPESLKEFALSQLKVFGNSPAPGLAILKNIVQRYNSRETGAGIDSYIPDDPNNDEDSASLKVPYYAYNKYSGYGTVTPVYLDVKDFTQQGGADRKKNLSSIYQAANQLTRETGVPFRVITDKNRAQIMAMKEKNPYGYDILPITFLDGDKRKAALAEAGNSMALAWYSGPEEGITMPRAVKSNWLSQLHNLNDKAAIATAKHEIVHHFQNHNEEKTGFEAFFDNIVGAHSLNPFNLMSPFATPLATVLSNEDIELIREKQSYYQSEYLYDPKKIKDIEQKIKNKKLLKMISSFMFGGVPSGLINGGMTSKSLFGPGLSGFANGGAVKGFAGGGEILKALGKGAFNLGKGAFNLGKGAISKVSPFLKQLAFALPNKINEIKNYLKVRSMIKDGMYHGSQPTGLRGEEYLQGKNVLEGAETYDPHYGMGFFGTSSKSEADMYASGYNSSTNWGESFGSINQITKAPFGKYVDFTRGTNSIKWQNYKLYQALGMKKDGYLGSYLTENLGDIMAGQNVTGSIMNRINDGMVPGDLASAKWLAWAKPRGVHTEEYMGSFAPKKPASLLDSLKSKFSLLNKPKGFNTGGHIKGPGTATSDSIPAYLSNGEYVIKASSVKKYGVQHLDAMNAGKYHEGGSVGDPVYHSRNFPKGHVHHPDGRTTLNGKPLNRDGNPAGWDQIFKKENWEQTANFFGLPAIGRTLQDMKTYGGPLGLATAKFDNAMGNLVNRKGQLPFKSSAGDNLWAGLSVAPIGRPLARVANWLSEKIGKIVPQSVKTGTAKFLASQGIDIFTKISDKLKTFAKPKPIVPKAPSSSPVVSSPFELGLTDKLMAKIKPSSTASILAKKYPEHATQINARLTPNHILRQRFLDIKKTSQPRSPEWEEARKALAISDALKAAKESGVIPLMDLKDVRFEKLLAENRALPSTIEEPVTIRGKDYTFKFTKGELSSSDRSTVEAYLENIRSGSHRNEGTTNSYAKHEVQILDPTSKAELGHIRYDPVAGSIGHRGTNKDYLNTGISAFLYDKAASFTRIQHSALLSPQGSGSADRMGGFLSGDEPTGMFNSSVLSVLPKFKAPSLPKLNLSTFKEYIGKLTSKTKKPKKTNNNRNFDENDPNILGSIANIQRRAQLEAESLLGWQNPYMLERGPLSRAELSPEVRAWFENPYRTSKNFPYGDNGYVHPEVLPELQRITQREIQAIEVARRAKERSLEQKIQEARRLEENWGPQGTNTFGGSYLNYLSGGGTMSPIDYLESLNAMQGYAKGGLIKRFAMGSLAQNKMSIPNYKLPSYAVGSTYIPQDQIAQLHKGERVLTAQENKTYSSSSPTTNIININGSDLNKKEIAQAVMVELDRTKNKNNKTNMVGR
jgi:TP901 family phage tail tape measure protein